MKKNIMFQALSIAFLIGSVCLSSCQWHTIEPIKADVIDTTITIYYSTDIQPVFDDKCISCHTNTNPKLTTDVSYDNLISGNFLNTSDPESSIIITKITDGHYASYSLAEQTLLLTWIQQGAENN